MKIKQISKLVPKTYNVSLFAHALFYYQYVDQEKSEIRERITFTCAGIDLEVPWLIEKILSLIHFSI